MIHMNEETAKYIIGVMSGSVVRSYSLMPHGVVVWTDAFSCGLCGTKTVGWGRTGGVEHLTAVEYSPDRPFGIMEGYKPVDCPECIEKLKEMGI